jgi:outer membrane immunogenic protein
LQTGNIDWKSAASASALKSYAAQSNAIARDPDQTDIRRPIRASRFGSGKVYPEYRGMGVVVKKLLIGSMAFAAVIAGPAMAADLPFKAPPPVAYYDWSGAYLGFSIGGVWSDVHRSYPFPGTPGVTISVPPNATSSGSDAIYDVHMGAQWQWGQWVLGVEAGYSAGFKEMQSTSPTGLTAFFGSNAPLPDNKITNLFTVGPRLGFAWDRWMIYGTGGYAAASIKGQYVCSNGQQVLGGFSGGTCAGTNNLTGQSWNDGWFAGGGFEHMVHKGALVDVVLGAEYQHFDVRSKRAFTDTSPFTRALFTFDQDARGDIVRARLTIKTQGLGFWEGGPVGAKY